MGRDDGAAKTPRYARALAELFVEIREALGLPSAYLLLDNELGEIDRCERRLL